MLLNTKVGEGEEVRQLRRLHRYTSISSSVPESASPTLEVGHQQPKHFEKREHLSSSTHYSKSVFTTINAARKKHKLNRARSASLSAGSLFPTSTTDWADPSQDASRSAIL